MEWQQHWFVAAVAEAVGLEAVAVESAVDVAAVAVGGGRTVALEGKYQISKNKAPNRGKASNGICGSAFICKKDFMEQQQ